MSISPNAHIDYVSSIVGPGDYSYNSTLIGDQMEQETRATLICRAPRLLFIILAAQLVMVLLFEERDYFDTVSVSMLVRHMVYAISYMGILCLGVFNASERMRRHLWFLKRVKEVCKGIGCALSPHPALTRARLIYITIQLSIVAFILYFIAKNSTNEKFYDKSSFWVYLFTKFSYLVTNMIAMQFVLVAMAVNSVFRAIVQQLEDILSNIRSNVEVKGDEIENCITMNRDYITDMIPIGKISIIIDTLGEISPEPADRWSFHERVRRLAHAYVSACHVVRRLNRAEELLLMFLLLYFSTNFVFATVLFKQVLSGLEILSTVRIVVIALDYWFWCFLHVARGFLLVTPCDSMDEEVRRIKKQVSKLICSVQSKSDPVLMELEKFSMYLELNRPSYIIFGLYTLQRPLVIALAIGVITYLAGN